MSDKQSLRRRLSRLWSALPPGPAAKRAGTAAAIGFTALLAAFVGAFIRPGLPGLLDPLAGIAIALAVTALAGAAVYLAIKLAGLLPRFYSLATLAAMGAVALVIRRFNLPGAWRIPLAAGLVTIQVLLAGAVAAVAGGGFSRFKTGRKAYTLAVLALALAANIGLLHWFFKRGAATEIAPVPAGAAVRALDLPDPAAAGPFRVQELTYGSGTDKRRPEFGKSADIVTAAVDARPFVKNNAGWRMSLRRRYWGFGFDACPINGRVWHPEGEGPFPLVVVVHGNHGMQEYSDPGYEYLGRLLASRGCICVSVDENFFNGSFLGGLRRENDGRGWLLLQHLKVWRSWADEPGHPFEGRVDMDRIALIGHSRGGEAAAIAACFNRLPRYPDDATVPFDFDFAIRGVIAIAPSDGQYLPADRPTPLEDVSYLVLQGGYDADVSSFMGDRQFQRIRFTGRSFGFAASVYARRANHSQFNTVWGDSDWGWPNGFLLNRTPLLPSEEQRRISAAYISAFLETVLKGREEYLSLFKDPRAGAAWLPEDVYVSRYRDSTFRTAASFEEDVDVTTGSVPGVAVAGRGLAVWREQALPFRRDGGRGNQVVYAGWRKPADAAAPQPSLSIEFEPGALAGFGLDAAALLTFCLAATDEEPPEPNEDGAAEKNDRAGGGEARNRRAKEPPDLTIVLETPGGRASVALSACRPTPSVLESRFTKYRSESALYGKSWEPVLQTYEIPLSLLGREIEGFDSSAITAVRFVFDRTAGGVVALDDIGFARSKERAGGLSP